MAGNDNLDDEEGITGINVTPLVDVMLVLLVIFMVTANYMTHNALGLQLPKAASGDDPGETNLNFSLDASSELFLDGQKISFEEVQSRIRDKSKGGGEMQALISADAKTPHGEVIRLMDLIKRSGVGSIAFNVEYEADQQQR
jgi:biopolymer transport protein ExbD